jgi:hypothetical protein
VSVSASASILLSLSGCAAKCQYLCAWCCGAVVWIVSCIVRIAFILRVLILSNVVISLLVQDYYRYGSVKWSRVRYVVFLVLALRPVILSSFHAVILCPSTSRLNPTSWVHTVLTTLARIHVGPRACNRRTGPMGL